MGVDEARIVRQLADRHAEGRAGDAALGLDQGVRRAIEEIAKQRCRLSFGKASLSAERSQSKDAEEFAEGVHSGRRDKATGKAA